MKKELGTLFGAIFWAEAEDEETLKYAENWIHDLEARERRVRSKEIELDLHPL